ncbi:MAG: hypothetical protein ND895_27605 [Pyrinomonadaceae bacterium]|nr:hypothetical protein [Pyrinomonadaceae bacterium]
MEDILARIWDSLLGRVGGPMTFRIILQPTMATLLAVRGGLKDAREGRPPYLWTALTDPEQRAGLFREGWKATARVFFLAVFMDIIYQWIVQRWIYPGEVLIVAVLLSIIPYLLIRGPVTRVARWWRRTP